MMPKTVTLENRVKVKVLTLTALDKANLRPAFFLPPAAPQTASLIASKIQVKSGTLQPALITPTSLSDSTHSDRPSPQRLTSRELIQRDKEDRHLSWAMTEGSDVLRDRGREEWRWRNEGWWNRKKGSEQY